VIAAPQYVMLGTLQEQRLSYQSVKYCNLIGSLNTQALVDYRCLQSEPRIGRRPWSSAMARNSGFCHWHHILWRYHEAARNLVCTDSRA